MTDSTDTDLAHVLDVSARYYEALANALGDTVEIDSHRNLLAQGTVSVVLEHGVSILSLVERGFLASATVLLRAQFEAIVRALWLHYCADDTWIERYFAAVRKNPAKDPNISRGMDDMLADITARAPTALANMLQPLKQSAWGPLNSYVHSGIHAIVHQHAGAPAEFSIATLRNSNGLSGMAATLTSILTQNRDTMLAVTAIQHEHLDCLPPLNPTPTPPPNSPA
jgi:hypothetical protein